MRRIANYVPLLLILIALCSFCGDGHSGCTRRCGCADPGGAGSDCYARIYVRSATVETSARKLAEGECHSLRASLTVSATGDGRATMYVCSEGAEIARYDLSASGDGTHMDVKKWNSSLGTVLAAGTFEIEENRTPKCDLVVEAAGGALALNIGGSPLVTRMDITQAILDGSSLVSATVANNDTVDPNQRRVDAEIQFTIVFTPGG